jgi:hypothetical protein
LLNLPCKFLMQVNMGAVMLFWSRMIGLFLAFYSFFCTYTCESILSIMIVN